MNSVVCDASALVAVLLDSGPGGQWASESLLGADLAAPYLVSYETANILRRQALVGQVSLDQASQAHADLADLRIEYWPYEVLAARAWELRENLSVYDASYVAVAELVSAPLVTLDRRLARAPGVRCEVWTPPTRG